jgi:predicted nuclease of predicted toxin-antitoxin system
VDENLPAEAVEILAQAGHDAVSVLDQGLGGQPDPNVATVCQKEHRVLVTLDLDFADIRAYPPVDYSGVIVLRLVRLDKPRILPVIQRLVHLMQTEPLAGKLWIVDETTVRVRG